MINTELLFKLKEAGYPLKKGLRGSWHGQEIFFDGETNDDHQKVYFEVPSLSELIESCGDGFSELSRTEQGNWYTIESSLSGLNLEEDNTGMHNTPEDAVMALWLVLNKK